jgi:hypothetical protein
MPQIMKVSFLDGPTFLRDSNKMSPEQRRVAEAFGLQLVSLLRAMPTLKILFTPTTDHLAFTINPNSPALSEVAVRRIIALQLRRALSKVLEKPLRYSANIFPEILPGHLSELDQVESLESDTQVLKKHGLTTISVAISGGDYSTYMKAFDDLSRTLGIKINVIDYNSASSRSRHIDYTGYDILFSGSGFWPVDPFGDLQMLFTKGLHPQLNKVTNDDNLQALISNLNDPDLDLKAQNEEAQKLNKYIYHQFKYNIYARNPDAYIFQGFPDNYEFHLSQSGNSPYPWMFFTE